MKETIDIWMNRATPEQRWKFLQVIRQRGELTLTFGLRDGRERAVNVRVRSWSFTDNGEGFISYAII